MKKFLLKIVSFFMKDHTAKYIVVTAMFVIYFIFLMHLAITEVVSNVFGTVVGFLLSSMMLYVGKMIAGRLEDMLKINYDTKKLLEVYSGRPDYEKKLQSKKIKPNEAADKIPCATFAYAEVLVNEEGLTYEDFSVEDNPKKVFELDDFAAGNYATIFSAHSNSAKRNFDTIRLDRYDPETKTFHLSRSTYFNHLVTNRAVDFQIFDDVSLRTIYEYGPQLNPLEDSKMSNHVGINALVFLSDNRLLIPRRKNSSTISKNRVTSSIAVMLNFPDENKNDTKNAEITVEYLLKENIYKNLSDRVKLPKDAIKREKTEIKFLGFGQNIYEGGKPQFYFSVKLNNIDTAMYWKKRSEYEEELKRLNKKEFLDVDKCMYVANYESFRYGKSTVKFDVYDKRDRTHRVNVGYEMSYLCNLWHYEKCKDTAAPN